MKRRTVWVLWLSHWLVRRFAEPELASADIFVKKMGLEVSMALSKNPGKMVLVKADNDDSGGCDISVYVLEELDEENAAHG